MTNGINHGGKEKAGKKTRVDDAKKSKPLSEVSQAIRPAGKKPLVK